MTEVATRPEASPIAEQFDAERQRRVRLFGGVLLIVAESMVFLTFIAIRFLLGSGHPDALDQRNALVLTAVMAASLLTMYLAHRAVRAGRHAGAATALLLTSILGLATAGGVGYVWSREGIPAGSPFGEAYYTTMGAHSLHLILGAIVIAGLAVQAGRGQLTSARRTLVRATYWFWIFLFVAWLAVYAAFYLL